MDISLHYLTMANHLLIQKRILEKVKESGLTLGQPKVLDYLKNEKPAHLEVILTGQQPSEELMALADYVSEIRKIKHPFDQGLPARPGIEK